MSAQCSGPQLRGQGGSREFTWIQHSVRCLVNVSLSGPQVLSACWWGCPSDSSSPLALLWGSKWMQRLNGNLLNMMPPGPWDPKFKMESKKKILSVGRTGTFRYRDVHRSSPCENIGNNLGVPPDMGKWRGTRAAPTSPAAAEQEKVTLELCTTCDGSCTFKSVQKTSSGCCWNV